MITHKTRMNGTGVKAPPKPVHQDGDPLEADKTVGEPAPRDEPAVPDPEVVAKATRRRFTAEFKLRVVRAADGCTEPGEIGALLRREGIYSSLLTCWRRERERGELEGLTPKKRGAKPTRDPRDVENEGLKRQIAKLEERLRIADIVCEAQKKVALILGITLAKPQDDERPS